MNIAAGRAAAAPHEGAQMRLEFVTGNMLSALLHELAHTAMDEFDLPGSPLRYSGACLKVLPATAADPRAVRLRLTLRT